MKVVNGEAVGVPIDITWNKDAKSSRAASGRQEIIKESKNWRKANGGKKPKEILYYGAFGGNEDWVHELKATLGYNTHLPAKYEPVHVRNLQRTRTSIKEIEAYASKLTRSKKQNLRVLSFGDEISLGSINYKDAKLQEKFRGWLKTKGITKEDLGVELEQVASRNRHSQRETRQRGSPGVVFAAVQRGGTLRRLSRHDEAGEGVDRAARADGGELLAAPLDACIMARSISGWTSSSTRHDDVLGGGLRLQRAGGAADRVVAVRPDALRGEVSQPRRSTYYVMPHAPGQEPGFLRRNMVLAVGFGARHIDNFWIGPEERFTENYVAWKYTDTFRVLERVDLRFRRGREVSAERQGAPGRDRDPDRQGDRLQRIASDGRQGARTRSRAQCKNAPKLSIRTLCRKEQQMLYLALRHAQHAVDCITEEDILDGVLEELRSSISPASGSTTASSRSSKNGSRPAASSTAAAAAGTSTVRRTGAGDAEVARLEGDQDDEERVSHADAAGVAVV